jgi:hypothetical protein
VGDFLGLLCERLTGHRMGRWVRLVVPENALVQAEYSRCRWCRQGYVRPMPLEEWRRGQIDDKGQEQDQDQQLCVAREEGLSNSRSEPRR